MFKLHVFSKTGDIDEQIEIEGDTAIIGRASDCNVVLDRKDISRRHARILHGWVVDDLSSRNGTYVAGAKLDEATLVPSLCFEVGDPSSENLVTVQVIGAERPRARPRDESDPEVTETGLEEQAPASPATTISRPASAAVPSAKVSDPAGSSAASRRGELEAETERYRYKCAKLELELEALRRKFESFQRGASS